MKNRKVILSSILSLACCLSLIIGGTFALFTSASKTNISINSGKVDVLAEVTDLKLFSHQDINIETGVGTKVDVDGTTFPNEGTATYANGTLTLDRMTPGDGVTFNISVTNNSNVAIKHRTVISDPAGSGLINALAVSIDGAEYVGEVITEWTPLEANGTIAAIPVSIELPTTADNAYQNKTASLSIAIEAVQGNVVEVIDTWDGTSVGELSEDLTIDSATELVAFATAVNGGNDYAGKEVKLNANIDLGNVAWTSIGAAATPFAGTFDGQGYTISNLSFVDSNASHLTVGLFHTIAAEGEIKNVNLKTASADLTGQNTVGFLVATLQGKAENCSVKNATITTDGYLVSTGAMFGNVKAGAVVDDCHANGVTITATGSGQGGDCVGGLIGNMENTGLATVSNSSATNVTISINYRLKKGGGFVGVARYANLENCTVSNVQFTVADYYQYNGAFVGTSQTSTFTNCDVNGAIVVIAGSGAFGGFAGRSYAVGGEATPVYDGCDVTGLSIVVTDDSTWGVGGFIGDGYAVVANCSVVGEIDATDALIATNMVNAFIGSNNTATDNGIATNVTVK